MSTEPLPTLPVDPHPDEWLVDPQLFAQTYSVRVDEDPYDYARLYQETVRYAEQHPDASQNDIGAAMGIPRSRVRCWVTRNQAPNLINGLRIAHTHGWLRPGDQSAQVRTAFATIGAAILAAGSVSSPHYQVVIRKRRTRAEQCVREALESIGVGATVAEDRKRQGDELMPACDDTVLGRALVSLGFPLGGAEMERVPDVLQNSEAARHAAGRVLAATVPKTTASGETELRFAHLPTERGGLMQLVDEVVDGEVAATDRGVRLSRQAVAGLDAT
jgi:hypothetical protein